jgi:predicted O-methyltransferase YrrM
MSQTARRVVEKIRMTIASWKVSPPEVPAVKSPVPRLSLRHFPRIEDRDHPTRWNFPSYLDNPGCRWLQALKEMYAMPIVFPASVSPEAGLMLHGLIRNLRPRVIVEVGTFCSVSTHWMASALHESGGNGVIHAFDDFGPIHKGPWRDAEMLSGRLDWVKDRLAKAGLLDRVIFHPGDSPTELVKARDELARAGGVQFAFIDGDHTTPGALQDLWAVEPVLNTGGYVMLHDTFPEQCGGHEGPRHILDNLNTVGVGLYEACELYLSPLNYGMGLMRRVG